MLLFIYLLSIFVVVISSITFIILSLSEQFIFSSRINYITYHHSRNFSNLFHCAGYLVTATMVQIYKSNNTHRPLYSSRGYGWSKESVTTNIFALHGFLSSLTEWDEPESFTVQSKCCGFASASWHVITINSASVLYYCVHHDRKL